MTRKKLKLEKALHPNGPTMSVGKDCVVLVFNRPLHRLEAMGIMHMVEEDLKGNA